MNMIYLKLKALEWSQHFSHYESMGSLRRSKAANRTVHGLIWPNYEHIQVFMVDLVTCKNKEDPIKNEGAKVATTLSIIFNMLKGS